MPANKTGGPRKGQVGKKAQMEKMIESAKRSQSPSKSLQNASVKHAGSQAKATPKDMNIVNVTATSKANAHSKKAQNINVSTITRDDPPELGPSKSATIRLPGQDCTTAPKSLWILHQTSPLLAATRLSKPLTSSNKAVVHLPAPKKKPTGFLDLPGEVRTAIYDHLVPVRNYRIQYIPRKDQRPTELTYTTLDQGRVHGPRPTAEQGRRRRDFDIHKPWQRKELSLPFRHPRGPAALLFVCKQVNQDVTGIVYGRSTFSFSHMRPMKQFLDTLRPETRALIRSLEIIHCTAGNPTMAHYQTFKDRHDACWDSLCGQIRDQCTQLHSLAIDLTIKEMPFITGPQANWMNHLYNFGDLAHLKHFRIRLQQSQTKASVLQVEAYIIRKNLMTEDNYYEPDAAIIDWQAEKATAPAKKAKTLRITGNVQTRRTGNAQTPRMKRSTGVPLGAPFVPNPEFMPQHPFDWGGMHKQNGTGPYRGNYLRR
ncbi:MAG: hypothetical protein Q9183_000962 [Haloplaca sp. 2 TL-2023]